MAKKIGMGLDRLLSEVRINGNVDIDQMSTNAVQQLAVHVLQPGRYQPRSIFSQEELRALADSIKQHGVLQPIVARYLPDTHMYEIIAGERRWRAAKLAGLETVPAVVRELSDQQAMALALIENLQRENLTTWELINALHKLVQEFHMTHDSAAKLIGCSRSSVSNLLRLLELPVGVQELLRQQKLEMGHARALLMLNDAELQLDIAKRVVDRDLTVRATERLAKQVLRPSASERRMQLTDRTGHDLAEDLSKMLSVPVQVKTGKDKGSGRVIIEFKDIQELERLMTRLRCLLS